MISTRLADVTGLLLIALLCAIMVSAARDAYEALPARPDVVMVEMTQVEAEWWAFFKTTKSYAMQVLGQPFECEWDVDDVPDIPPPIVIPPRSAKDGQSE